MTDERLPWYVRLVVGIGAWITAVVLMFLGGAIVFVALEFETGGALALIGAAYLWAGLRIIRQPDRGIFANQLGVATAAAGAALVCGGFAAEAEEVWVGVPIAVAIAAAIFMVSTNRILQFLASALAAGFFVATLIVEKTSVISLLQPSCCCCCSRCTRSSSCPTCTGYATFKWAAGLPGLFTWHCSSGLSRCTGSSAPTRV